MTSPPGPLSTLERGEIQITHRYFCQLAMISPLRGGEGIKG